MKKILLFLILLVMPIISCNALTYPDTYSSKVLVYDITDEEMLYEKNSETTTSIASLTKIMTVYTAVLHTDDLDKKVTLTNEMLAGVDSSLYIVNLKAGESYSVRELCYAAMIASGGDATYAIARIVAGSLDNFVVLMNEEAEKIGMTNTHFMNVHGLDQTNHYSTAKDLSKLILKALENEDFKDIYYKDKYQLSEDNTVKRWYASKMKENGIDTNNLLGGKTGTTSGAGVCFAGVYLSDEHTYLIIVLNAPNIYNESRNIDDMITLMKFIDDNYNYYDVFVKGDSLGSIPIFLGKDDSYEVTVPETISLFLPSDYDSNNLYVEKMFISSIMYGSKKGHLLGSVNYFYKGEKIGDAKIYLNKDIEGDISKIIKYYRNDTVLGVSLVVLVLLIFAVRYFNPIAKNLKKKKIKKDI